MVIKFDVPGDGSCLFWSVALAYLIPVRGDDALFRERYEVLFGNEQNAIQDHVRNLVRNLNTNDSIFANLVRNIFRTRLVNHICSHKSKFKNFIVDDFDSYLTKMNDLNTWGGELEIRAMSEMLEAHISVSGSSNIEYNYGKIQINLLHVGPKGNKNHYNFNLEDGLFTDDELEKLKNSLGKLKEPNRAVNEALNDLKQNIKNYLGKSLHFANIFAGSKGICLGHYDNQNSIEERSLKFAVLTDEKDSQNQQIVRCCTISHKINSSGSRFSEKEKVLVQNELLSDNTEGVEQPFTFEEYKIFIGKEKKGSERELIYKSFCKTQEFTGKVADPCDRFVALPVTRRNILKGHSRAYARKFIENLFKIHMSEDVLVDIIIDEGKDKDPNRNKIIIVGRPEVLGSSTKQMRHVTPYSFLEYAIKSVVMKVTNVIDYLSYIDSMVDAVLPLIKSKKGICLKREEYLDLLSSVSSKGKIDEVFKFTTVTSEQQRNEYHLIYNDTLIEIYEQSGLDEGIKQKARDDFKSKFEKYINYGLLYLKDEIINSRDLNTVTNFCEGLARIILTMFNQDKYAAFPQEGNSLLEKVRLYESKEVEQQNRNAPLQTQKQRKAFEVRSHAEITEEISHFPDRKEKYDLRIRIIDNEGIGVKNTAETLRVLNRLISHRAPGCTDEGTKQNLDEYNNKYNLEVKMKGLNQQDYNNKISIENLDNVFHHHVAKHLYVVFDFKPLEARVLAPRQRGDDNTIKVYPSSTGTVTAEYSVQEGNEYRALQFNARKGYNPKAIFRSEMTSKEIKEALCRKIVSHIIICLIPFQSIKMGPDPENDAQAEMKKVFESFIDLVQKDYKNAESKDKDGLKVDLDDNWKKEVYKEYNKVLPSTSLDVSGVSCPGEENYISF